MSGMEPEPFEGVLRRKRVLIFYADMGAGHRSVALSIRAAMQTLAIERSVAECVPLSEVLLHSDLYAIPIGTPSSDAGAPLVWQTDLYDPIAQGNSRFLQKLFSLYAPVTRHMPYLFAGIYHLVNSEAICHVIGKALSGLLNKYLCYVLRAVRPDVIVCVNSLLIAPILCAMKRCVPAAPLFTVVTDLVSIHHSWAIPNVDRCFVPTSEARDALIAQGMPAAKLQLSGLPIHPAYRETSGGQSRGALRHMLGLNPQLFTVLIVGGGEGVGQLEAISGALQQSGLPLQLVIVAGRNHALYRRLVARRYSGNMPVKVYGYTYNMPTLMHASNVIITKGGSVTLAEALSCGVPVLLSGVIGGQESGNIEFVVRNGVGKVARTCEEAVQAVKHLLAQNEREQAALSQRVRCLSMPDASFIVASAVLHALESSHRHAQRST